VGNFPGVREFTSSHGFVEEFDNHSDTMQLAVFENLDGMSLGELLDCILRFLMRSWISYASVGARNNEFFEFICLLKCLSGRGWFYNCRKGFSNF